MFSLFRAGDCDRSKCTRRGHGFRSGSQLSPVTTHDQNDGTCDLLVFGLVDFIGFDHAQGSGEMSLRETKSDELPAIRPCDFFAGDLRAGLRERELGRGSQLWLLQYGPLYLGAG